MHTDRFYAMHGGHGWERGPRHGRRGPHGPARLLPFVVGALAMRAALRQGRHHEEHGGEGRRHEGRGSWGRGPWAHEHESGEHEGRGPWGSGRGPWGYGRWGRGDWRESRGRGEHGHGEHGHGEHGHDAPWGRGRHGRRDFGPGRAALFGLRAEVVPLALLLRDAFRGGRVDERKVGEIRAVLAEAHRRIAAILDEPREGRHNAERVDMV